MNLRESLRLAFGLCALLVLVSGASAQDAEPPEDTTADGVVEAPVDVPIEPDAEAEPEADPDPDAEPASE